MRVTVFGTGYVGLVHAAILADSGHDVVCVDTDAAKIAGLERGVIPIFEPGLDEIVLANHREGRLKFTTDAALGVAHGAVQFVAVGTPPEEDGSADLSHVVAVAETIGRFMTQPSIIVVKSTVPVGTCDKVRATIARMLIESGRGQLRFDVAFNPEFLKQGAAVADSRKPDRIILGVSNPDTEATLRELYASQNRNHEKIIVMDARSAELTKYAANCMLATKISLVNEIANLADMVGADIELVRLGIGADPRIGNQFIYAGLGFGGSCFPKDVRALIHTAASAKYDMSILKAVEQRNLAQKEILVRKIRAFFGDDLSGRSFALWGLAFKANTNDMRDAPARLIMERLWERGATIRAYDPRAMEECRMLYGERGDLSLTRNQYAALDGADALIVATEWKSFMAPDFDEVVRRLKTPAIFDGRNLYDPRQLMRAGISYFGIGRGSDRLNGPARLRLAG